MPVGSPLPTPATSAPPSISPRVPPTPSGVPPTRSPVPATTSSTASSKACLSPHDPRHAAQQRILREPHPRHRLPRLRPERNLRKQALDAIAVIDKADKDRKLNNLGIIIAICCGVGGLILSIISLIRADQSDSRMDELENRVTILESRATILERSGPPQK